MTLLKKKMGMTLLYYSIIIYTHKLPCHTYTNRISLGGKSLRLET